MKFHPKQPIDGRKPTQACQLKPGDMIYQSTGFFSECVWFVIAVVPDQPTNLVAVRAKRIWSGAVEDLVFHAAYRVDCMRVEGEWKDE
jgi:hypothetical protein